MLLLVCSYFNDLLEGACPCSPQQQRTELPRRGAGAMRTVWSGTLSLLGADRRKRLRREFQRQLSATSGLNEIVVEMRTACHASSTPESQNQQLRYENKLYRRGQPLCAVLLGSATLSVLDAVSFVDPFIMESEEGFQRPLDKHHAMDFRKYFEKALHGGKATAPPVILRSRSQFLAGRSEHLHGGLDG